MPAALARGSNPLSVSIWAASRAGVVSGQRVAAWVIRSTYWPGMVPGLSAPGGPLAASAGLGWA